MFGERFLFKDREDAANQLAELVQAAGVVNPYVFGIPRGGVPIARVVADGLRAPLSVFISRKIGAPGSPEFGIGAIAEDGTYLLDSDSIEWTGAKPEQVEASMRDESKRCADYVRLYRSGLPLPSVEGMTAVLCDDGLATGITMLAAAAAIRKRKPMAIVIAVPVASRQAVEALVREGAVVLACHVPFPFHAVAQFYELFDQMTDEQVAARLDRPVLYNS